jgi:hypothetical protein
MKLNKLLQTLNGSEFLPISRMFIAALIFGEATRSRYTTKQKIALYIIALFIF